MYLWFRRSVWGVCAAASFIALAYWPVQVARHGGSWLDYVDDDAFYYFVIAKNMAAHHLSSFDGTTATNGYQPLWQLILAIQAVLFPGSFSRTIFVEVFAAWAASMLTLRLVAARQIWLLPLFTALLVGTVRYSLVLDGMEISILLLAFSAFALALGKASTSAKSWLPMAICGSLVAAGRLDAAVFVLPAILLVSPTNSQRVRALAFLGVCGFLYVVVNKIMFDAWLPVSGSVKSLGGFGLNRLFLQQVTEDWNPAVSVARTIVDFIRHTIGATCLLAVLTVILILACPREERLARRLALAVLLGLVLYAGRIVFFSSWRIWGWYEYPILLLLISDLLLIGAILRSPTSGLPGRLATGAAIASVITSITFFSRAQDLVAAVLLVGVVPFTTRSAKSMMLGRLTTVLLGTGLLALSVNAAIETAPNRPILYGDFAKILAKAVREKTDGAAIAMGDRAGSFAYFYGGPVSQLEGLVDDTHYLNLVKAGQPIEPLLCERGARYLLAWEEDLGNYSSHAFHVYRPQLTSAQSPTINVSRADEVMKLDEANHYAGNVPDRHVYLWKLSYCDRKKP